MLLDIQNLISIIVPIYNVDIYLQKCILSILQQTYKNLQIILVDDGSTDNSGKVCDDFAKIDNRIIVIHKKNGGLVDARKAGLSVAEGEYIGFVDGDDWIDENMYEKLLKNIVDTNADFVHTGFFSQSRTISQLKNKIVDITAKDEKCMFLNRYVFSIDNDEIITPSIWSKLFRADFLKKCYMQVPDSQSMGEDLITLLLCILYGNKISIMEYSYYYYNIRSTSMTQKKDEGIVLDIVRLFEILESHLIQHDCYNDVKNTLVMIWLNKTIASAYLRTVYNEFDIVNYKIINIEKLLNKKIILYGAGKVGRDFYSQIIRYSNCEVVAWVDSNYNNIHYGCTNILKPESVNGIDFDILLIAVKNKEISNEIKKTLVGKFKINENKIIWIKPESFWRLV